MEYNVLREHLVIREYGRHVQNLINHAKTIEDKKERQKFANAIIDLMGLLNPQLKNVSDFAHKLWDHLFIMSNFELDVESPYGIPSKEIAKTIPADLPYPGKKIRFKHYGKNVETMIEKAKNFDTPEQREGYTEVIANFMKMAYRNWSAEEVSDDLLISDVTTLSKGDLAVTEEMNVEAFVRSTKPRKPQANSKNKNRNRKRNRN